MLITVIVVNMIHFKSWSYIKNMSVTTICVSSPLIFATHYSCIVMCYNNPIVPITHPHVQFCICTHSCPVLSTLPRHDDVWGNFTGHRGQISVIMVIFDSVCSVFVSCHASCISKHTYTNSFKSVCTVTCARPQSILIKYTIEF